MTITPEEITAIVGAPYKNTAKYWPLIIDKLKEKNLNKTSFQCAIVATVGVESGNFVPISEYGGHKYFHDMYDIETTVPGRKRVAIALGNIYPGDGVKFHGKGFVQITGRANHKKYGDKIGVDLINHPELANEDHNAVALLVEYMQDHGIDVWADRAFNTLDAYSEIDCTKRIRRLVNGGLTHYDKFKRYWDLTKKAALS